MLTMAPSSTAVKTRRARKEASALLAAHKHAAASGPLACSASSAVSVGGTTTSAAPIGILTAHLRCPSATPRPSSRL